MTKIRIHRKREAINTLRNYQIIIDSKFIEEISNGETKEISVEKGIHSIKAKIDWCSSNTVEFKSETGDEIDIHVSSCIFSNWITTTLLILLSIIVFIFSMERTDYNPSFLILLSLFLIFFLWRIHENYLKINYKQNSACMHSSYNMT